MLFPRSATALVALLLLLNVSPAGATNPEKPQTRCVRVIYLVSADREENPAYTAALDHAIRDLQKWYARQLGGPTFRLNDPAVEVVKSNRPAHWFYDNPNGLDKDSWGFLNTLSEAQRLVGTRQNDPDFVWAVYSDGPGNKGRGGCGAACLPEDDLLGLVGKHPTQKDKLRWIGGLGHEIGHAFGLPHPKDLKKHADAIMHLGFYGKYPDKAYLTPSDKRILRRSPFFFHPDGRPVFKKGLIVARYVYQGGAFNQHAGTPPAYWTETKTGQSSVFSFEETGRDDHYIRLHDASRGISVRLPVDGGLSSFSSDDAKTWHTLFRVAPTPTVDKL